MTLLGSKVYTIEAATGIRRKVPGASSSAVLASNGESLAHLDNDGNLIIMSISRPAEVRKIDIQGRVAPVAWSPDSSQVAIWKADGTLQVVDSASGLQTLPPIFESEDNVLRHEGGVELSWPSPRIVILNSGFGLRQSTFRNIPIGRGEYALTPPILPNHNGART